MRRPNMVLAEHLTCAGWRPSHLVTAVNDLLGDGYLSRSAVSEWLHAGRVPRDPLPAVVAQVLEGATGRRIAVNDLWPRCGLTPAWTVTATDGLAEIARSASPATALAQDWLHHADHRAGRDRRRFIPVPDHGSLPGPTRSHDTAPSATSAPWAAIACTIADQIVTLAPSPASIRFAYRQLLTFAETVLDAPHDGDLATGLAVLSGAAADLAHVLGQRGLAQRYRASSAILSADAASGSPIH